MKSCSVEGCDRDARYRGYCTMHYQRVQKYGTPGPAAPHSQSGARNGRWKGGRVRGGHKGRYWMRHRPDHPAANSIGYVLEHRLIMEAFLGRLLRDDEVVHHINEDSLDNHPENLALMTRSEHTSYHTKKRWAS